MKISVHFISEFCPTHPQVFFFFFRVAHPQNQPPYSPPPTPTHWHHITAFRLLPEPNYEVQVPMLRLPVEAVYIFLFIIFGALVRFLLLIRAFFIIFGANTFSVGTAFVRCFFHYDRHQDPTRLIEFQGGMARVTNPESSSYFSSFFLFIFQ